MLAAFLMELLDNEYYNRALSSSEISYIFTRGAWVNAPWFILHPSRSNPSAKRFNAGSLVTFTANAAGDAPIGYQWRFNGADLVGQKSNSLSLTNVQSANAGNYSVAAINAAGSVSSSNALLTILPAPPCVTVTNGLVGWWKAKLICLMAGIPMTDLYWSRSNPLSFLGIFVTGISYVPAK